MAAIEVCISAETRMPSSLLSSRAGREKFHGRLLLSRDKAMSSLSSASAGDHQRRLWIVLRSVSPR
jgi:hypothetical protein